MVPSNLLVGRNVTPDLLVRRNCGCLLCLQVWDILGLHQDILVEAQRFLG